MKMLSCGLLILVLQLFGVFSNAAEKTSCRAGFWYLPGYHEQNANGDRSGYGYAYMEKIAACMGWNIQYTGYDKSWAELLDMLENGEIDLLTNATQTPEREKRFDYADRPIGLSFTILTVKAGDNRFHPNAYANWNGMRIGMIRASSRNQQFADFAAKKGFHYVPVVCQTYKELEAALANGTVDALLSTNSRRTKNEWILEKINPDPIYIIVRKGNKKLLESINRALSLLEINAPNLNETLILRYYSTEIAKDIPLTAKETGFIEKSSKEHRVFRALIKPDRTPLSTFRDGEIRGIFRDIAELVKERSRLDIQVIPCRDRREYDEILRSGEYDIIFDAWQNYPHAERSGLYLTEPYFISSVSLLQLKKRGTPTGKRGTFKNSLLLNELSLRGIDASSLVLYQSTGELIDAVLDGTIDAGYLHTQMATLAVNRDKSARLTSQIAYGLQTEYAIGVRRDLPPELIRIIAKAVRSITDDDLRQIVSSYEVPPGGPRSLRDWIAANPLKTTLAGFFVLLFVIGLLIFVILSSRHIYRTGKVITRLPVRFFVADREENILLFNAPGLVNKQRRPRTIAELDEPDMADLMSRTVKEAFAKGVCSVDYVHASKRRSARAERLFPEIFGRETVIWISQNTEELQASREQLRLAAEKAQTAEKAKSFFLATMSHEIRTPLNAVIGFAELLKNGDLPPAEQKEYLNDVSFAGNALLALINDVLDLSKLEAGQMDFVSVETDFEALLREVVTIFQPRCGSKHLRISVSAPPLPHVFIDHLRIRQILFNLIGNAVKFTESGEIRVTGSFTRENQEKGTLTFAVKDTGRGISEEDQKILFQPFVQSKAMRGTQAANNGTGLGLAIVSRMIQHMNGNITLVSAPGRGSTFTVTLGGIPFKDAAAEIPAQPENAGETGLPACSILLVDDVAMNLKVESAMLKRLGMTVVSASSAAEALEILNGRVFDYILTDMWMPGMNGDEFARQVRGNPRFEHIRIAAVTADAESQSSFDMSVFNRILTKPVTQEKLRDLLAVSAPKETA